MRVLVTGGSGYIGSALVAKLLEHGREVVSIDDLSRGDYSCLKKYEDNPRLKAVVGDICHWKKLDEAMEEHGKVDAAAHLAAITGLERCQENPEKAVLTNVYGTYNVLEIARKYDIGRVVFSSSAAVYGNPEEVPIGEDHPLKPINLYGVTKLAGEKLLSAYHDGYGLSTVALRFGNVYGVGLYTHWDTVIPKFIRQALDGRPLTIYGDGRQSRDFIHVWDIVEALELALDAEDGVVVGETFNVGSGESVSVNAIAETISKVFSEKLGQGVRVINLQSRRGETYIEDFRLSPVKIENRLKFKIEWNIERGVEQLMEVRQ